MEPQKYYDFNENNGTYCVHFANRHALSIEEITEIFKPFGYVVGVSKAGDEFGYRFVKFFEEKEVIRCVEGMKNHPRIQLKVKDPSRKKAGNRANNYCSDNQKNSNGGGGGDNNNRRRPSDAPTAKTSANERLQRKEVPRTQIDQIPDTKETTFEIAKPAAAAAAASLRQPAVAANTFTTNYAKTSHAESTKNSGKLIDAEKFVTSRPPPPPLKAEVVTEDFSAVAPKIAEAAVTATRLDTAENPKLVAKNSAPTTAESKKGAKIVEYVEVEVERKAATAEEVVVANIHRDFGVHYILHLIRKHEPLCVSEMKIIPTLGLRYCIVYLQSKHQARAIVKEFDRFILCEKELIVTRPQELLTVIA